MVISVDKIIVKDRIRKDFGDIAELAADIKENGLISPIVVNKDYVLLAGERRLRAVKHLGWSQVEVRMMDTRDAEHELNIEISENDVRKAFSKSERVDYMYRLMRIEQEKARERQEAGVDLGVKSSEGGRAKDKTAEAFGIGRQTMEREMSIVEHKDLLDPKDFADWDEGKLSTNKAYQQMKARTKQLEEENQKLHSDNKILARRAEPTVVEKTVEVKVVPDDYEETKKQLQMYRGDNERLNRENKKKVAELSKANELLRELQAPDGEKKVVQSAQESMDNFSIATYDYIRRYGGNVWSFDKWADVPESTRKNFAKAIQMLSAFAQQMADNVWGLE